MPTYVNAFTRVDYLLASFVTDIDVPADNGLTKTNHSPGVKQPLEDGLQILVSHT